MINAYDYCEPELKQIVPGVNREDHESKYSHAKRFCAKVGEGISDDNISLRAIFNKDHASNVRDWCESANKQGENLIRQAFASRDKLTHHWQRTLRHEIDNLTRDYQAAANCLRLLLKTIEHLNRVSLISKEGLKQRMQIPQNYGPDDLVNKSIEEEMTVNVSSSDDATKFKEELYELMRKLEGARKCLISDAEAKSMNLTVSKSCQHNDILLSLPYYPEDKLDDQPIRNENEQKWENDINERIQIAVSLRESCTDCCRNAENTVAANASRMAAAWQRSNNLLNEEIQKDEYDVFKIKQKLNTTVKDITTAEQRLASLRSDQDVQHRVHNLTEWRNQRLTYRPGYEHIKDCSYENLQTEKKNVRKRSDLILNDIGGVELLFENLVQEKGRQLGELASLSKKLFIDRDCCLGLRNSVRIDGTDGKNV